MDSSVVSQLSTLFQNPNFASQLSSAVDDIGKEHGQGDRLFLRVEACLSKTPSAARDGALLLVHR